MNECKKLSRDSLFYSENVSESLTKHTLYQMTSSRKACTQWNCITLHLFSLIAIVEMCLLQRSNLRMQKKRELQQDIVDKFKTKQDKHVMNNNFNFESLQTNISSLVTLFCSFHGNFHNFHIAILVLLPSLLADLLPLVVRSCIRGSREKQCRKMHTL